MKEKILASLKTKFEGVKDEILDRIAAKAAKTVTNDDELKTYIEGVTIQTIIDAYGDSRATDAQKTAVANYEKKHKIKDGKPVAEPEPEPEPKPKEGDDAPAWAKAMMAEIAQLKGEKVADQRKAKLNEVLKDAPESVRKMYEGSFAAMQFADDEAFDTWLSGNKETIDGLVNDLRAKGSVTHPPKGGGTAQQNGEVNPALKAQVEAAKAATQAGGTATILGMPSA